MLKWVLIIKILLCYILINLTRPVYLLNTDSCTSQLESSSETSSQQSNTSSQPKFSLPIPINGSSSQPKMSVKVVTGPGLKAEFIVKKGEGSGSMEYSYSKRLDEEEEEEEEESQVENSNKHIYLRKAKVIVTKSDGTTEEFYFELKFDEDQFQTKVNLDIPTTDQESQSISTPSSEPLPAVSVEQPSSNEVSQSSSSTTLDLNSLIDGIKTQLNNLPTDQALSSLNKQNLQSLVDQLGKQIEAQKNQISLQEINNLNKGMEEDSKSSEPSEEDKSCNNNNNNVNNNLSPEDLSTGDPGTPSTDTSVLDTDSESNNQSQTLTPLELDIKSRNSNDQYNYTIDQTGKTLTYTAKEGYGFNKVNFGKKKVWEAQSPVEYATKVVVAYLSDQQDQSYHVDALKFINLLSLLLKALVEPGISKPVENIIVDKLEEQLNVHLTLRIMIVKLFKDSLGINVHQTQIRVRTAEDDNKVSVEVRGSHRAPGTYTATSPVKETELEIHLKLYQGLGDQDRAKEISEKLAEIVHNVVKEVKKSQLKATPATTPSTPESHLEDSTKLPTSDQQQPSEDSSTESTTTHVVTPVNSGSLDPTQVNQEQVRFNECISRLVERLEAMLKIQVSVELI